MRKKEGHRLQKASGLVKRSSSVDQKGRHWLETPLSRDWPVKSHASVLRGKLPKHNIITSPCRIFTILTILNFLHVHESSMDALYHLEMPARVSFHMTYALLGFG